MEARLAFCLGVINLPATTACQQQQNTWFGWGNITRTPVQRTKPLLHAAFSSHLLGEELGPVLHLAVLHARAVLSSLHDV